ncbi:LysR family transcriptional regulator [Sporolactobacillus shoreicorticis]|uniref:LysR family transcriptional regulator n=1 Tax=Sporolactobacillus shoreicorticis TaxID=1923877 RepID=A0ABW5S011_9BACL|nr:LysR family transcriptional regulator [Sporolactobacillus shoreicorticis]MCO7125002.1 LysR family transcriptional regulator [Sporolactobacillus shoreicorticis]
MTIDQLNTFLMVVKCRSFHGASKRLFLSQPSVTSRIQALEQELNVNLFVRQGRGIRLSDQGEKLVPIAKRMVKMYHKAYELGKNKENTCDSSKIE